MYNLTDPADVVVRFGEACALTFGPATPAALIGARRAYRQALKDALERDPGDAASASDAAYAALGLHLARVGLKSWTGIGDAGGATAECTPQAFTRLMAAHPGLFGQIDADYVAPILLLDAEKNASSASATGTSRSAAGRTAKAAPTVKPKAAKTTTPKKASGSARTAVAVPTASTKSKATRAKSPGRS